MNQNQSTSNYLDCVLWTALVTPFDDQSRIDFDSLRHIALQQARAGNGILLLGSTGEGLALTLVEQTAIVDFVCSLSLNVLLMVAVGGYQLPEQLAWIEHCNALQIDAFLLGAPLYAKPGPIGQKHWFEALLNQANYPCMLYNVPSRSGVNLSPQMLAQLQHHDKCWALKEASGDIAQFLAFRKACPAIALFSGEDNLLPYLAQAGAKGVVSVASNVWPDEAHEYVRRCLSGQLDGLFPVWHDAISALFSVSNPIAAKVAMAKNGAIASATLRPPLIEAELGDSQALLLAHQQIGAWYQRCKNTSASHSFNNKLSA